MHTLKWPCMWAACPWERMGKRTYGDMNGRMSEGSSEKDGFHGLCSGCEVAVWWHMGCVMVVSCIWVACGLWDGHMVVVGELWAICELWDGHMVAAGELWVVYELWDGRELHVGCMQVVGWPCGGRG